MLSTAGNPLGKVVDVVTVSVAPPPVVAAGGVKLPVYPLACEEPNRGTVPPPAGITVGLGDTVGVTSAVLLHPTNSAIANALAKSDETRCIKLPPGRLDVCLVQHSMPSRRWTRLKLFRLGLPS